MYYNLGSSRHEKAEHVKLQSFQATVQFLGMKTKKCVSVRTVPWHEEGADRESVVSMCGKLSESEEQLEARQRL